VSYVWGCLDKVHTLTLADGLSLPITESVHELLPFLRYKCYTGYLWIDQIGINQRDVKERNHQVELMGTIFQQAERTLAWLGDVEDPSSLKNLFDIAEEVRDKEYGPKRNFSFATMTESSYSRISTHIARYPKPTPELLVLTDILKRPWFRRAWIYQEALLSSELVMVFGDIETSFLNLAEVMHSSYLDPDPDSGRNLVVSIPQCNDIRGMAHELCKVPEARRSCEFSTLLDQTGGKLASNARDHIYAFLGFQNNDKIKISPDYDRSIADAFTRCAKAIIIGTQSLDLLATIRIPGHVLRNGKDLNSWVPDWSQASRYHQIGRKASLLCEFNSFKACSGRRYTFVASDSIQKLKISGRVIARVRHTVRKNYTVNITGLFGEVCHRLGLDNLINNLEMWCPNLQNVTKERLLRVLLADGAAGDEQPLPDSKLSELLEYYESICNGKTKAVSPLLKELEILSSVALNRRVFCTVEGGLGLGTSETFPGDEVVIAHGSNTPLILRQIPNSTEHGYYTLVGECYLEDAMYGESCTWKEEEGDTLSII
jgi:hypothetical protein